MFSIILEGVILNCLSIDSLLDVISANIWIYLSYMVPFLLVLAIFCYGKFLQNHSLSAARESHGENKKQNSIKSLIIIITALYFILWLPFFMLRRQVALPNDEHNTELYREKHTVLYK